MIKVIFIYVIKFRPNKRQNLYTDLILNLFFLNATTLTLTNNKKFFKKFYKNF